MKSTLNQEPTLPGNRASSSTSETLLDSMLGASNANVAQQGNSVNQIQKANSAAVRIGPLRCCLIQKSSLTCQFSSFRSSMAFFRATCSRFFCTAVLGFWISDVGGP